MTHTVDDDFYWIVRYRHMLFYIDTNIIKSWNLCMTFGNYVILINDCPFRYNVHKYPIVNCAIRFLFWNTCTDVIYNDSLFVSSSNGHSDRNFVIWKYTCLCTCICEMWSTPSSGIFFWIYLESVSDVCTRLCWIEQ